MILRKFFFAIRQHKFWKILRLLCFFFFFFSFPVLICLFVCLYYNIQALVVLHLRSYKSWILHNVSVFGESSSNHLFPYYDFFFFVWRIKNFIPRLGGCIYLWVDLDLVETPIKNPRCLTRVGSILNIC